MSNSAPVPANAPEWPHVGTMSDREIAEETLTHLRSFTDALTMLAENPMVAALMAGESPMAAMLKR